MIKKLFTEAFIVGIMVVLGGTIIGKIIAHFLSVPLPQACKNWNKYYIMEITLFLTGISIHLLCELTGINRWYCKHGAAC